MSQMQCQQCKTDVSSNNFAVIQDKRYCLTCLTKNPSLLDKTSSTQSSQQATKQCQVCYEEKPNQDYRTKYNNQCQHNERLICDACLYNHIKEEFTKMCTDDARCPELNCRIVFDYDAVQKILSKNKDRKLLEKYERFVLQRQLEKMAEFIWCAYGCGSGQLNEGGDDNNIVRCIKCHKRTCFTHKVEWHEGLTCNQYDEGKDVNHRKTHSWISQNCKKCPQCSARIQKADGCDHMTCASCRYEFCWSCLADYNQIRKDGNHRHEPTCKHYAPYH